MIRSALALLAVCALFCPASAEAGKWLQDESGDPTGDYGISGLTHVGDTERGSEVVWAITDGECGKCGQDGPGYLLRIRARDARLTHAPIPIGVSVGGENDAQYAGPLDFECLAAVPGGSDAQRTFLAATENEETPRIVEIEVRAAGGGYKASLQSAEPIEGIERYPGWEPENDGKNSRIEGCALGKNDELYLAFERDRQGQPILFETVASKPRVEQGLEIEADWMELLPIRNEKLPNFNGLAVAGDLLLILVRDQERVIGLDLVSREVSAVVELDLVAPTEKQPSAFSPEGIATDGTKVWIVNDPWDVPYHEPLGGNRYKNEAWHNYYLPLNSMLFERPLNYFGEPTAAAAGDDEVTPIEETAPTDEEPAAAMKPGESARQEPPSPASERLDEAPPAPTPEQEMEPIEDADLTDDGHETAAPVYGFPPWAWVVLIVVIFILAATWWRRRSN